MTDDNSSDPFRLVIIPDSLVDAINAKLDEAYRITPAAAVDREAHFHALLDHFDKHGVLPDFTLQKMDG